MNIALKGIVSVAFIKKSCFTGSCKMMHYRLAKYTAEEQKDVIRATVWKGPYSYSATKEEKQQQDFSLDPQGLSECESWLNEMYLQKFKSS